MLPKLTGAFFLAMSAEAAWATGSYLSQLVTTAAHVVGEQAVAHPSIATAVVATGAGLAAPLVVGTAIVATGFTAGGIAAGSTAAWWMGTYGGYVGAGTTCAVLQSIGAAGLGSAAWTLTVGTGAAIGGWLTKSVVY